MKDFNLEGLEEFMKKAEKNPKLKKIFQHILKTMGLNFEELTFNFVSTDPMELETTDEGDYTHLIGKIDGKVVFDGRVLNKTMLSKVDDKTYLQTLLQDALDREDYLAAAKLRDKLNADEDE